MINALRSLFGYHKWRVGDMAIFIPRAPHPPGPRHLRSLYAGDECEIYRIVPSSRRPYRIRFSDGETASCRACCLKPIRKPPEGKRQITHIPADDDFQADLRRWLRDPNKTRETEKDRQ